MRPMPQSLSLAQSTQLFELGRQTLPAGHPPTAEQGAVQFPLGSQVCPLGQSKEDVQAEHVPSARHDPPWHWDPVVHCTHLPAALHRTAP